MTDILLVSQMLNILLRAKFVTDAFLPYRNFGGLIFMLHFFTQSNFKVECSFNKSYLKYVQFCTWSSVFQKQTFSHNANYFASDS